MRIRLADILYATKNYDPKYLLTSGGFGSVYRAKLDHVDKKYCFAIEGKNECEVRKTHNEVAIKCIIDTGDEIEEQGFYAEIDMLTSCKHSNILTLLGFCDEGPAMILIYEYASNGSLNYHLQNMSNNHSISWAQRVKICLNAAKGLSFLHSSKGDGQEIVHRDIKSANILLDQNFEAKIGDFGLSVFLSVGEEHRTPYYTKVAGTPQYIDPQYSWDAKLKRESDVYSFGVVMFEMLCGTLAYDPKYANNKGLALVARQNFIKGTIKEMVDPKIKEEITETLFSSVEGPSQESLDTFSKIAYECLTEAQDKRPTMEVVVKELEKTLFSQENRRDNIYISYEDIQLVTDNFNDERRFEFEEYFMTYKGEVSHDTGHTTSIAVRRYFASELPDLYLQAVAQKDHKHENVIAVLGFSMKGVEKFVVYEHPLNGNLGDKLDDVSLTWGKRLKICIDIASGLKFLHGGSVGGEVVIHRDIKSDNILLDGDMNAKIANFEFCRVLQVDQDTILHKEIAGTQMYTDPEYESTGLLSKECDIYSFGIVLFEVMFKRPAYSDDFLKKGGKYLGPIIKSLYKEGKLDEMVFEGTNEPIAPQSLAIFRRIAIQCLHEKREERPTAGAVMIQLKEALEIQEKGMEIVRIPLKDIKHATRNFSDDMCIGSGYLGKVYKAQIPRANEHKLFAVKRVDRSDGQETQEFYRELEILFKFQHRNVTGLEGYCDEMNERIIVQEYASLGSLNRFLNDINLTWMKRLDISIDVASGLAFLHGDVLRQEAVIHRDIKSNNILLSSDWEAKITDFGHSLISPNNQEIDNVIGTIAGTEGYNDPSYIESGIISKASDIYSFGVVLFEILCGRSTHQAHDIYHEYLGPLAKNYYEQNKLSELVFEGIKKQIVPQSLSTFANIAYDCLHDDWHQRPTANEVVARLNEAKEFQVDNQKWELKLPSDYKEIIQQSRTPEICYTRKKKDLYDMFYKGIRIQKGKVWFSLDSNNNRNEMISSALFTYNNQSLQNWIHISNSRFKRVPMMMDISNLKIQAKIEAQFLTPDITYGVYLVFIFVEPNKVSSKSKYVNLRYKKGNETLHSYFATWRYDKWMMVELYRFVNHKNCGDFEVSLDSFSRYYCGSSPMFVEGIEFRAIENVTQEEIEKLKDVQQIMRSNSNVGQTQQFLASSDEILEISENSDEGAKLFQPNEMNLKKHHMISAKEALYRSSDVNLFKLIPLEQTRFREVIEVLSQQVCHIKCKIKRDILSPYTDYSCYLIFKLSEKCRGLHCPVKVRGSLQGSLRLSNKVIDTLYFRSPNAWNIHDINQVPKQREDGWMEVNVWNLQSKEFEVNVNLKFISYEGTMSGLIVCGLEFRPM